MQIVPVIHQANALGLRVQVNPETNQVMILGDQTPEAAEVVSELTRRKGEVVQAYIMWVRFQELMGKECLWMEESRELLHLADRFGQRVHIQRTILGGIYDLNFGRVARVSSVSNLETINKLSSTGDIDDMAKISDVYQSTWLKAEDLQNRAVKVQIESCAVQEFKDQSGNKERKVVVAFAGKAKRLICNKSQAGILAKLHGDDTDFWRGHEVILSPVPTSSGHMSIAISGVPTEEPAGSDNPF